MTASRSTRSHLRWLRVIMSAGCILSCAAPRASVEPEHPSVSRAEPVRDARELLVRLHRGELPGGIDHVIADLDALAAREGATARGTEARRLAAELFIARFATVRDPRDRDRAAQRLDALAESPGPSGCGALLAAGDLLSRGGSIDAARGHYLRFERQCPDAPDLAHVHATLALMDPNLAHAESDAMRNRVQHAQTSEAPPPSSNGVGRYRRIVIDPGHGGSDPGARSANGLAESSVTLDVARRLADRLVARTGADVLLTRDRDVYVALEERAVRANRAGADLFLSIHCNSTDNPAGRGVSTYVLDATDDRVAARVARRENGDVQSDPLADPEVFRILADLRLIGSASRSTQLAGSIQHGLLRHLRSRYPDVADLGVHTARFHVLVGARMPAVLIELSFLSNPVEAARLGDAQYRDDLADAITDAVAGDRPQP